MDTLDNRFSDSGMDMESMVKKLLLTGIAALFLATGTAHAMPHDLSNTWCADHASDHVSDSGRHLSGREEYYAWIEKCHRRHGTNPCWGITGWPDQRDFNRCGTNAKRRFEYGIVPLPMSRPPVIRKSQ